MNKVADMSPNHVGNPPSVSSLAHLCKLRYLLSLYVCQSRHRSLSPINFHNHRIMLLALAFLIITVRTFTLRLPCCHKRFPNLNRQTFPLRLLSHILFSHSKVWLQSLILSRNLNLLKLAILFLKRHPICRLQGLKNILLNRILRFDHQLFGHKFLLILLNFRSPNIILPLILPVFLPSLHLTL